MHHREIRLLAEDFGEVGPQPAGGGAGVELGLHHDLPADDVKGSPETQHCRGFRLAAAGLRHLELIEFILHRGGHCHDPQSYTRTVRLNTEPVERGHGG